MSKIKFYEYKQCGTCRKAQKYLQAKGLDFEIIAVREVTPEIEELQLILAAREGNVRKILNTSGQDYRAMKLGEKLKDMSETEILELIKGNGNLVKRPLVISGERAINGFKEEEWNSFFAEAQA